ncbi:MAG TPA: peptidylprolyl isomerase [Thioalkalivibrio sp.]|nr:peptidylprolyl isomerase [Thioalkalivibrio sp.]
MQIAKNSVVVIDYTLTDDNGDVVDSSAGGEPLAYIQGIGQIIPGLENALEGKSAGDEVSVKIPPAEGYGDYNEGLIQVVPREMFQGVDTIEPGMQFHAQTSQGIQAITVTQVEGDDITIDGNHPLAGKNLNFAVTIKDVREATGEELDHGHVHGPGGHQH